MKREELQQIFLTLEAIAVKAARFGHMPYNGFLLRLWNGITHPDDRTPTVNFLGFGGGAGASFSGVSSAESIEKGLWDVVAAIYPPVSNEFKGRTLKNVFQMCLKFQQLMQDVASIIVGRTITPQRTDLPIACITFSKKTKCFVNIFVEKDSGFYEDTANNLAEAWLNALEKLRKA